MIRPSLALVIAAGIAAAYTLINPVHDTDILWQVTLGDLILEHGGPIRTEPFYPDAVGRPIIVHNVLSQIWYSLVRKAGGWELIKLFDAVFWSAAFFLPALAGQRRFDANRGWPSAVALLIGAATASKFYMTRPQTFAMLGLGALLAVLLSRRSTLWKWIVGTICLIAWQNSHPSVVVAVFVLGLFALVSWLKWVMKKGTIPLIESLLFVTACLAVFATPAGSEILTLMRVNSERVKLFELTEWLPVFHPANRVVNLMAIVGISATLIGTVVCWRKIEIGWMIVMLAFAGLTIWSHRFVVFFGVIAVPVWIQILSRHDLQTKPIRTAGWKTLILFGCLLTVCYGLLLTHRLPLWNSWLPIEGFDVLKQQSEKGTVFTQTDWGGLIVDRGYPDWRPTHDGRYFARTQDECEWYLRAVRGEVAVEEIESRYHPVAFFLSESAAKLIARLNESSRWRMLHRDENCVVFVR